MWLSLAAAVLARAWIAVTVFVGCCVCCWHRCAAGAQLTALRFDEGGLQLAAGTSSGLVGLWDLRQRAPLLVKDHMYGAAIRDIKFHSGGVRGHGLFLLF
jgi:hypothetical protein